MTREYLSLAWSYDRDFDLRVAGGHHSVFGVVHDQRVQGRGHVFGFVDRDFGVSNYDNWDHPDSGLEVFIGSRLEIENFLLDWPALAGCRENINRFSRKEEEIQQRARDFAQRMLWWMACRAVLSGYRMRLTDNSPEHPRNLQAIQTQADAERYIREQPWFGAFPAHAAHIQNSQSLGADLTTAHTSQQEALERGGWPQEYSGKEIFRHLRGYLFNRGYASDEEMDIDLAKSVAAWQVQNNAVPAELLKLRDIIKLKVGI